MSKVEEMREIKNNIDRSRLKNKNFTLIASNCNGAFILHDLGLEFNSPFVNLWLKPDDFIRYLQNIEYYTGINMKFIKEEGITYPVGMLDDVRIYFQHYKTEEEAESKWLERSKRMNMENLFILFTDRDGCTKENLKDFDALPWKNKTVFTHIPYPDIKSAYYISGFEKEESVGLLYEYRKASVGEKYYDEFDYVSWFNHELD
jgi:uncharacterized protein (DUF1919 family)